MNAKLLAVYREIQHSPGRESDDALILERTAERLRAKGFEIDVRKPEEVARGDFSGSKAPALVFMMCEREGILDLVASQSRNGLRIINPPESVLNTYRYRMVPLLKQAKAPMPRTVFFSTSKKSAGFEKAWVKRGDVHNTRKGDVFLAKNGSEIEKAFKDFAERGIAQACLQDPVEGDLIKFYGVGTGWFKWFYHKNQDLKKYRFSEPELKKIMQKAARTLGLEIYGGDAIVSANGSIVLIDLNAWPSFALFREEASQIIAGYIAAQVIRPFLGRERSRTFPASA